MTLRVLVVDDQAIARAGIATMLDAEDDLTVVGQSRDGEDAVRDALELRPDVVVMDIRMPRLDGIAATRRIVAEPSTAVVLITTFDDDEHLFDGIAAGASGFLLKDSGPDLMAAAVRSAARGDSLIDPAMTRALIEQTVATEAARASGDSPAHAPAQVSAQSPTSAPALAGTAASRLAPPLLRAALDGLSDRELDVLDGVARGLSNVDIAQELYLSIATVKTHISNLLAKTGTRTRVQAAVFAYESGFARASRDAGTGAPR
ncbi:LuxR family two component transcriptional regulator [Frigoribacterium sp. PhB107]|uniref:response regulator transcription factor n=1 Tax=Frigoribacterium sp. PhB107 TaxID=2485172 RepID=UPI000F474480|nr:response regulator transcription factor [Frigoribacterium sp. PhB107]ROP73003.1 LuxR family two component transcriptional regulator [Frigoribacterium sp. PhB107]